MANARIIKPSFENIDERGIFRELVNDGEWRAVNYSTRKKGSTLGNHYHKRMQELIFLLSGRVHVKIECVNTGRKEEFDLSGCEGFIAFPFERHTIEVIDDASFIALLSEKFDKNNPDIFK